MVTEEESANADYNNVISQAARAVARYPSTYTLAVDEKLYIDICQYC